MTRKSYTAVINYLDDNKIHIDKDEFELQLEGHPNFPSLLAFSDALHFFNIENYSYRIDNDEKDILPEDFLALVKGELAVVNNIGDKITVNGSQTEDFFSEWENIILIIEKPEEQFNTKSKLDYTYINWGIVTLLFLFLFVYDDSNLVLKLIFAATGLIGFIFAREAYKKTHGKGTFIPVGVCKSNYLNTDCDLVFNSKKWKIFNKIDLSEISLLFFTSQIVCFILLSLIKNIEFFFEIYQYGLFAFIPVAFLSLFYQVFVVKKYCPVCMVIITSVCIQLVAANLISFTSKKPDITVVLFLIGSLGSLIVLMNFRIKNKKGQKDENTLKRNLKFRRNYQFFKNNLSLQKKVENKDFSNAFVFGNEKADQTLTFITNPFCKHCKEFYPVFLKLVKKYSNELRINIFFDIDLSRDDLDNRTVHVNLTNIYINSENKIEFLEALSSWYDVQGYNEDKSGWYHKYSKYFGSSENALALLKGHEEWVSSNGVHFTPNIFINDTEYPVQYERADLEFFIPELLSEN